MLVSVLLFKLVIGIAGQHFLKPKSPVEDCKTLLDQGKHDTGVYEIQIDEKHYQVLCDQKLDGGGWTIIQQRCDSTEPFWNRLWEDYKWGFGEIGEKSNFYVGNQLIHLLSNQYPDKNTTLRIELYNDRNPNSTHTNDFYTSDYLFQLGDEATDFTLHISKPLKGNASTGWYDLTYSDGIKFSTVDRLNDPMTKCQLKYRLGGWWTRYCSLASLNGEYVPQQFGGGYGLFFTIAGGYAINPERTRMLLKAEDN